MKTRPIPALTDKDVARFWSKIDRSGGPTACWAWTRATVRGYGSVRIRGHVFYAHRVAFLLDVGVDPGALGMCHRCDNPPCCNPAHLFLGTQAENTRDMVAKGRARGGAAGERHHSAKLNDQVVLVMRSHRANGGSTGTLARLFGVSLAVAKAVCAGRTWRHVGGPLTRSGIHSRYGKGGTACAA